MSNDNSAAKELRELTESQRKSVNAKKFALVPAPFENVMTLDEAVAKADQQILDGKAKKVYILEVISVVTGSTKVSTFEGE